MKVFAYLSLFLLAVALGFLAGLGGMLERASVSLEARLEARLGVDIDLEASHWTWDGRLALEGLALRWADVADDTPAWLRIRRLEVDTDVSPLRMSLQLAHVAVDGVQIDLDLSDDRFFERVDRLSRSPGGGSDATAEPRDADADAGAGGGGLSRWLAWDIPHVVGQDVKITLSLGDAPALSSLKLPPVLHLEGGHFEIQNPAVLKEEDRLVLTARFADSSLDPGFGLHMDGVWPLREPGATGSVSFERPARVMLLERVLALGRLAWRDHGLHLHDVALSVPVTEQTRDEPVAPALTVERVVFGFDPGAIQALRGGDDGPAGALSAGIETVLLDRPAVAFEHRPSGHSFSDLMAARSAAGPAAAPDKALGPLMAAAVSAGRRLTKAKTQKAGEGVRRTLVTWFTGLASAAEELSAVSIDLARRVPFDRLTVKGGHFTWRDLRHQVVGDVPLSERLDNCDLELTREGALMRFQATFLMSGTQQARNTVQGRISLDTGDVQVGFGFADLDLHPYRHVLPDLLVVEPDTRVYDTDVSLIWSPASRIARLDGRMGVRGMALYHPAIAPEVLTDLDMSVDLRLQLDTERKTLTVDSSDLRLGKMRAHLEAEVARYDDAPRVRSVLRVDRLRCQDMVASLPVQLLPVLEGLEVSGTFGWRLEGSLDTADMASLTYEVYPDLHNFQVVDMGDRVQLEAVRGTFFHKIRQSDGTVRELLVGPESPQWVSFGQMSDYLVKAITTTEDGSFFRHGGFSPFAIRESIIANLKKGAFVRGASTISQQLVKNLFLSHEKTISRKLQEIFITWQMEAVLEKRRIMELYFNIIEWGPGIYGIRSAAQHYFDKRPSQLSLIESVFLVSLIPSPGRYYQQYARGEVTDGWRRHLRWIVGVMRDRGKITEEEFAAAAPYSPVFRGRRGLAPAADDDLDAPIDSEAFISP